MAPTSNVVDPVVDAIEGDTVAEWLENLYDKASQPGGEYWRRYYFDTVAWPQIHCTWISIKDDYAAGSTEERPRFRSAYIHPLMAPCMACYDLLPDILDIEDIIGTPCAHLITDGGVQWITIPGGWWKQ